MQSSLPTTTKEGNMTNNQEGVIICVLITALILIVTTTISQSSLETITEHLPIIAPLSMQSTLPTTTKEGIIWQIFTNQGQESVIICMYLFLIAALLITTRISQPSPETTTEHLPITAPLSIPSSVPTTTTENLAITDDIIGVIAQSSITTASRYSIKTSSISPSIVPAQVVTNPESEIIIQNGSIPTTITVAALAGVIGLLIILMIGGCALFLCFIFYRKHKQRMYEVPHDQYALPTELTLHKKRNSLPTSANSCYKKSSSRLTLELPDLPTVYSQAEIYSEIGIDGDSGLYDDIGENHYALIPERVKTDKAVKLTNDKGHQERKLSPVVTNEKENLQPFDDTQNHQYEVNPLPQVSNIKIEQAGIYSQVGDSEEVEEIQEDEDYTDMRGSRTGSESSRCSSCNSVPLLQLSKPLCQVMEDNPTYNSAWSLLDETEKQGEGTYAEPDANYHGGSQLTIYETIYSDSQVKPSIFKRKDDVTQPTSSGMVEQGSAEKSDEREEEKKVVMMYTPIYLSSKAPSSPVSQKQPLTVTNDHICGIEVLGTGFFGKVVLADTVGLSLKDLNLSDHDDDKSVSIRVAVKKLKMNASESTKEAFEKEYRFMSRLDHPNVIRMLGVCATDPSQFIMMEYMERGDLAGYLEEYESIVHSQGVPKEGEIHVSTLVYMCTQIADAMKYLVSHNFIHRDLAARNCLVGDQNVIKLADFGMSRNLYESHYYTIQGQAVLPVRWMATECFYGKFSAKTDVWAFGVTMWEIFMLAKERPYSKMEDLEVVDDAIEKEERTLLQQPDHCPDDVFEAVMKCWASDPKDRATFEELHVMLMQLNN